jgi:hypothetical protein
MKTDGFNFAQWLEEFGHGATNKVASERLAEIVKACELTGQKGQLTIKIAVGAAGGLAELRAAIAFKRPEAPLPGGTYYTTSDGNLVDEDPRQLTLPATKILDVQPFKTVTGGKSE